MLRSEGGKDDDLLTGSISSQCTASSHQGGSSLYSTFTHQFLTFTTFLTNHHHLLLLLLTVTTLLVTIMLCCCRKSKRGPVTMTSLGAVEGSVMKTLGGHKIYAYRGLPYAKPPLGKLRFKKPEPAASWSGVKDCRKESKKSLQPQVLAPQLDWLKEGGEDCLYLSVFTKRQPKETREEDGREEGELLPVIVFLHGGAFVVGSSESALYGPQILLDRDVILVGVNYRLGVLGFLSMETDSCPGNLGLWDQVMALTWVRDNIAQFGGDPGNVCLLGESAGAMSAMLHLVAPPSQGLFHSVIALSGTPNNVMLQPNRRPRVFARALAEKLGCSKEAGEEEVVEHLQKVKASQLLKACLMFLDWDYSSPMPWIPTMDSGLQEPLLPLSFNDAVKAGKIAKVPIIMGCCKDEGLILSSTFIRDRERLELLAKDWDTWAPLLFLGRERELVTEEEVKLMREVRQYHWPQGDLGNNREVDLYKVMEIYGMSYFFSPMDTDSKLLSSAGLPTYTMLVTQPTAFSLSTMFAKSFRNVGIMFTKHYFGLGSPKPLGVGHGDDLGYIFPMSPPMSLFPPMVVTPEQHKTRQVLLDSIASFVKTGKPSISGQHWESLDPSLGQYLEVGENQAMARDSTMDQQLTFWNRIKHSALEAAPSICQHPPKDIFTKIAIKRNSPSQARQ